MQIQDISLTQIVIVLLFLGVLILLQQLLKNNKFSFQTTLNKKKRIRFIDDFGLSNSERVRLIRVDDREYLHFSAKGCAPTVILHERSAAVGTKENVDLKRFIEAKAPNRQSEKHPKDKPNILSDAISNARKMNPKLGFKK